MQQQTNYDMMGRTMGQGFTPQQNQQQMMIQAHLQQNIAIQSLKQLYPETVPYRQTPQSNDFRVPLSLPVSPLPLYIKVSLLQGFPQTCPVISCMARVTHPNLEKNTYAYRGPLIQNWNQNCNLAQLVKAIHEEFKQNPPQIEGQAGQPQPQGGTAVFQDKGAGRYSGETVVLNKPQLQELKKRIMGMKPDEIAKYQRDQAALNLLYGEQPEVQKLKGEVERLLKECQSQTTENLHERQQLQDMFQQYDQKFAQYRSLKEQHDMMSQQMSSVSQGTSKESLVQIIGQRARQAEQEAHKTEKQFLKEETNFKDFMKSFVKQRGEYHKYQMIKVKVSQS